MTAKKTICYGGKMYDINVIHLATITNSFFLQSLSIFIYIGIAKAGEPFFQPGKSTFLTQTRRFKATQSYPNPKLVPKVTKKT
jgi:hypothetical protein